MLHVAKRHVLGHARVSWVAGVGTGGVSLVLAVYVIVLELPVVVLSWAEQEIRSTTTNMSMMTCRSCWVFRSEQGSGERVGGSRVTWDNSWAFV